MATSAQLYQLSSKTQLHPGAYVEVNGPYDSHGLVIKSEKKPDGEFLNLIRGCAPVKGKTPSARF